MKLTDFYLSDCVKYSLVAGLQGRRFTPGAVQLVQLAESTFSPDAEASNVTTRSEPQEVQFVDVLQCDAFTAGQFITFNHPFLFYPIAFRFTGTTAYCS